VRVGDIRGPVFAAEIAVARPGTVFTWRPRKLDIQADIAAMTATGHLMHVSAAGLLDGGRAGLAHHFVLGPGTARAADCADQLSPFDQRDPAA
jgi:hypothetical protein